MKMLKYFMIGVALMGVSATATAQDGTKADIDAVKNIISSKPADMDKQLNNFYKKNKKNVENLIAFSKAFYEAKDTARARLFADYTLKANKNYAPAYIMLGDLAALAEDGGGAAAQYEQAIYFDPKNPDAYRKYASVYRKISPAGAIAKLNDLRAQLPDYPSTRLLLPTTRCLPASWRRWTSSRAPSRPISRRSTTRVSRWPSSVCRKSPVTLR